MDTPPFDPIALRCAEIVTVVAKAKGFVKPADPATYMPDSGNLTGLALRDLVESVDRVARMWEDAINHGRPIHNAGNALRPFKVPSPMELFEEAFFAAEFHSLTSDTARDRIDRFRTQLSRRGLCIGIAAPIP